MHWFIIRLNTLLIIMVINTMVKLKLLPRSSGDCCIENHTYDNIYAKSILRFISGINIIFINMIFISYLYMGCARDKPSW